VETKVRTFRCGDELWRSACQYAGKLGFTMSDVLRYSLEMFAGGGSGLETMSPKLDIIHPRPVTADDIRAAADLARRFQAELDAAGVGRPEFLNEHAEGKT
jgi:hypothetical protein